MKLLKKNSISNKILTLVLSFVSLALLIIGMTVIGLRIYSENSQIDKQMKLQLGNHIASIENVLDKHGEVVSTLGKTIGVMGLDMSSQEYSDLLTQCVSLNEDTCGIGVFYDYNAFKQAQKYYGPYAARTKTGFDFLEDLYSTDEFDYPNQDWYQVGKTANGNLAWTAPYYDEIVDISMVTAAAAFYDVNNNFKGVVTGDVDLTSLQKMVSEIKIGETGHAFLVDQDGLYIADQDQSKVMSTNLREDPNASLAALGDNILTGEAGNGVISDNSGKVRIYYTPIESTGWTMAIMVSESELSQPIFMMMLQLIGLFIITLLLLTFIITKLIKGIINPIVLITDLFQKAELGDFESEIPDAIINRKDELGLLGVSFKELSAHIKENIDTLEQISNGNLDVQIEVRSEKDSQSISLNTVVDNLRNLESEVELLTASASEGNLLVRGDINKFQGKYKEIVAGFNRTLDAVVEPLTMSAEYIDQISKGHIPPQITVSYKGDFNTIKENINRCIANINTLVTDVEMLSDAAMAGQLTIQADETRHSGDFCKIINGFNRTLDTLLTPINEASQVMAKLAVNDYSQSITGSYKGDMEVFASEIKHVHSRLLSVQDAFIRISKGDTSRLNEFVKIGKRSDNDQLLPALITTLTTIDNLIAETTKLAEAGINGNLNRRGDVSKFQGGYRDIIIGFNQTLDSIEEPIGEAAIVLEKMAQGDLSIQMQGDYLGSYVIIKNSINNTLFAFNEILSRINNAADEVTMSSRQVSSASQALAQGATEQASTMEELNSAITEVAEQTKANAGNANQANQLSLRAQQNADQGNQQMREMLRAMEEINASSSKISNIIKVIDDIAFQTNILALNAAVEAARAGQLGKGFAVVAEEVRTLAGRSAEAVKETTVLIEGSISKVKEGTQIANSTAGSLNEIVDSVAKVADLVSKIDMASNDQAEAINQLHTGIDQVANVVQTNSATAEESAAASEELYGQAELLKNMVSRFGR